MLRYTAKRLLQTVIVLIGITLVTFILLNIVPGDPVNLMLGKISDPETIARIRHEMGLDRPWHQQYIDFLVGVIKGDLGTSYFLKESVVDIINRSFIITLKLAGFSFVFAIALGLVCGIVSAVHRGKALDSGLMTLALLGISAPAFWVAIILQIVFGLKLDLLPISGIDSGLCYILPAIAIGSRYAASIARITRTSMLDVIRQDYIRTARAKGLSERLVIYKHALKNAMIPIVTMAGLQLSYLLTGSILVETVFSIPGIGKLIVDSMLTRDLPLIQGTVMYVATLFVLINLIVDLSYAFLDPKIRYEKGD